MLFRSNGVGQLRQGYVETSNVNVVEELVSMIQNQRSYEINSKAISTADAMLSGAVHGYRGLIREILARITAEAFRGKKPVVVATGGDAPLIAGKLPLFDKVDPLLTLRGILIIAGKNPPASF
mgnify:CR=1 FL=1